MNLMRFHQRAPSYLDDRVAIHLIGSSGIGKTEAVHYLRQSLSERDGFEWGISTNQLAQQTPNDVMGFLMGVEREVKDATGKMKRQLMSEWSMPPWMISDTGLPMNSYKRGLVFFDEYGQADPDVKKAAAEPILNGRAGRHQLHPGIGIVMCSNNREHRSGVTRDFDFVINRTTQWTIRPHLPSWLQWAYRSGLPPIFVVYAETHPEVVFADKHPEQQGPWCTPRSYVRWSRIMAKDYTQGGVIQVTPDSRGDILEEGEGMIGADATQDFLTWVKVQTEVPTIDAVLKDPHKALLPAMPDAQLLVAYMMAANMDKKNGDKVVEYMLRVPQEYHLCFATAAIKRDKTLAALPALTRKMAAKNANMIAMLAAL